MTPVSSTAINAYSEDTLQASTTQTIAGQTAALPGYGGAATLRVFVTVTAISGAGATLTVLIDDSIDGTNWVLGLATSVAITATGVYAFNLTSPFADRVRVRWTISGTTPSVTFSVVAAAQSAGS